LPRSSGFGEEYCLLRPFYFRIQRGRSNYSGPFISGFKEGVAIIPFKAVLKMGKESTIGRFPHFLPHFCILPEAYK
jgi:hypothetical protein